MISMKILFHVWNLILFKGQKYHQGSLAYIILYSKTSVQNSFAQCPIVFVCDLWPVTCDLHFSPVAKKHDAHAELLFLLIKPVAFWRSRCHHRHIFIRSLLLT